MTPPPRPSWMIPAAVAVGVAVALAAFVTPAFHALAFLAPDSASYLHAEVGRTPLYPLVLRVVPLRALGVVQLAILAAAATWLAIELSDVAPPMLALAVEIAILGNPAFTAYAFTVLPEALFAAAEMTLFAIVLRLRRRPTSRLGVALGAATVALVLLKPSGYAFVAAIVVLLGTLGRDRRAIAAIVTITIAGVLAVFSAARAVQTGSFGTQSYGGYAAIGYVAQFLETRTAGPFSDVTAEILARTQTSRDELARVRPLESYYFVSSAAYHDILDAVRPLLLEYARRHGARDPADAFVRMNALAETLAIRAVMNHPLAYARHAAAHWYGLWFMPLVRNRADHDHFLARMAATAALAPVTMRSPVAYRELPAPAYWLFKLGLASAFVASLAGLLRVVRPPRWRGGVPLTFVAVALHANYLLVAAVQTGLPRYALVMWPAVTVLVGLGASGLAVLSRPNADPRAVS